MEITKVGNLYVKGRVQWPEIVEYHYSLNGHEILAFLQAPTEKEIQGFRGGSIDLALHCSDRILIMLIQFGKDGAAIPWSDCPFNWYLMPPERRQVPPVIKDGKEAIVSLFLIDANTGILKAMRQISLPTNFSRALHEAILEQINGDEISAVDYAKISAALQSRYSSKELQEMAQIKCHIKEPFRSKGSKGFGGKNS